MKRLSAAAVALTLALVPGMSDMSSADVQPRKPRKPATPQTPDQVRSTPSGNAEGGGGRSAAPSRRAAPVIQPAPAPSVQTVPERVVAAWPGSDWAALAVVRCETGGTWKTTAYNPAGPYYGLWQFDVPTWRSVGGSGLPSEASVEEQTRRAWELRQRRGWVPWPACSRKAGLR